MSSKKIIDLANTGKKNETEMVGKKVQELLEERRLSSKLLSEAAGISLVGIKNLLKGEGNPTIGTLLSIANFFEISLPELLGATSVSSNSKQTISVPLFDLRHAHQQDIEYHIINYSIIESPNKSSNNKSYFGVKISGSTLLPFYEPGTIFIFDSQREKINGDIVLARINNTHNVLGRYLLKGTTVFIKEFGSENEPISYKKDSLKIYGVALQIIQQIV